jgi:acetoin utilization protein AcuC
VRRLDAVGPLLVFGPRSTAYDLGPGHPLTPRRFGPGIDLLRLVGAEPGLAPEPATDAELETVHESDYIATVRALSSRTVPGLAAGLSAASYGLGPGDTPAFTGMHEASATVAGGSLRAIEAILVGEVEHAFHPGGGLHHAMPRRASGFCVYDDPALAIARARREGLRVLYLDFDVHHGDGVQAIHWNDPEVVTISFHETGRALFPGTGFVSEQGGPAARGSKLNVPLEPGTGERGWLAAVERVVPEVAEAFRPEIVVSQHGSDGHAWDPLAHLRLTTTAMGAAARLVDSIAHRWAGGRWLATGGGGYDVYRVVPRAWSLVWLAGAHRDPPPRIPQAWLERWASEAEAYGQSPLPERFEDPPNLGRPFEPADDALDASAAASADAALAAWRAARLS